MACAATPSAAYVRSRRTGEHDGHLLVNGGVPARLAVQQVRRWRLAPHARPVDLFLRLGVDAVLVR